MSRRSVPLPQHLLLIRGLVRDARHWRPCAEAIERHLDVRCHYLDLAGIGQENFRRGFWSVRRYAEDLRRRWRARCAEHPGIWAVVGASLGGMLAQSWVDRHPVDFSHTVLVNSSANQRGLERLIAAKDRFSIDAIPTVLRALLTKDLEERERHVYRLTSNRPEAEADDYVKEWASYYRERPIERLSFVQQIVSASRFEGPKCLPTPTLLLCSKNDALVDPVSSKRLAQRFDRNGGWVALETNDWANHDLTFDDPEWVAGTIASWMNRLSAG